MPLMLINPPLFLKRFHEDNTPSCPKKMQSSFAPNFKAFLQPATALRRKLSGKICHLSLSKSALIAGLRTIRPGNQPLPYIERKETMPQMKNDLNAWYAAGVGLRSRLRDLCHLKFKATMSPIIKSLWLLFTASFISYPELSSVGVYAMFKRLMTAASKPKISRHIQTFNVGPVWGLAFQAVTFNDVSKLQTLFSARAALHTTAVYMVMV